jgi:hypothetical protein
MAFPINLVFLKFEAMWAVQLIGEKSKNLLWLTLYIEANLIFVA